MKALQYDLKNLKGDIFGGVTTAVVALPLALALGVASGAGAIAGLYSAVFTGIISTIFGGTPAQINGPTGAMTVVLIEVHEKLGIEGLFASMLIAGILQILFGVLKLGKYIHLIPHPVVVGFTNGIGILIFLKMFDYFKASPVLALITMGVMFAMPFITKKIPASFVGLLVGTAASFYLGSGDVVGTIPTGLPQFSFPSFDFNNTFVILKSAILLALLGSIESLLTSVVVDEMAKTKHHSNRELLGQGIGNTVAALFGSLIGTGAIVRSSVNVNAGGRTRLSGILHGVIIFFIIIWLGPYASKVPMAVLGGILMVTALKMIEYNTTKELSTASQKAGLVILATMLFTVFTDLVIAVLVGTILAMFTFVLKMANVYLREYKVDSSGCEGSIASYTIEGPLFFGVSNAIISKLEMEAEKADIIVINLMNIPAMDTSGAISLKNVRQLIEDTGKEFYVAGIKENFRPLMESLEVVPVDKMQIGDSPILEVIDIIRSKHCKNPERL